MPSMQTYCPYCAEVKGIFQQLQISAKVVELDELGECPPPPEGVGREGGEEEGGCSGPRALQPSQNRHGRLCRLPWLLAALEFVGALTVFLRLVAAWRAAADGSKVQEAVAQLTGRRTVPQVFIGGKHVSCLHSGRTWQCIHG